MGIGPCFLPMPTDFIPLLTGGSMCVSVLTTGCGKSFDTGLVRNLNPMPVTQLRGGSCIACEGELEQKPPFLATAAPPSPTPRGVGELGGVYGNVE